MISVNNLCVTIAIRLKLKWSWARDVHSSISRALIFYIFFLFQMCFFYFKSDR